MSQTAIPINFNSVTITAGSNAKIYDLRIPQGYAGFITSFASTLKNSDCHLKWDIDGEPVSQEKMNYVLGTIDNAKNYSPPLVVRRKMVVWGYNDGATDEIFEVLVSGFLAKEPD